LAVRKIRRLKSFEHEPNDVERALYLVENAACHHFYDKFGVRIPISAEKARRDAYPFGVKSGRDSDRFRPEFNNEFPILLF
jgi:hypothetical protein